MKVWVTTDKHIRREPKPGLKVQNQEILKRVINHVYNNTIN